MKYVYATIIHGLEIVTLFILVVLIQIVETIDMKHGVVGATAQITLTNAN